MSQNPFLKPCPFCGGSRVEVVEGTLYRYLRAECRECGACAGEVRVVWDRDDGDDQDAVEALKRWNERALQEETGDAN